MQFLAGAADDLAQQETVRDLLGSGKDQTRAHEDLVEKDWLHSAKGLDGSVSGEVAVPEYYVSFVENGN